MRQARVDFLSYRVRLHRNLRLDNPAPMVIDTDSFAGRLHGEVLELRPKVPFGAEGEARAAIEPLLRSWEISAALDAGGPVMTFEFEDIRLVDAADPTAPGYGRNVRTASLDRLLVKPLTSFPPLPRAFAVTPDVESLWLRYRFYLEGREPLQSMAYFCFTLLKARAGGRNAAAKALGVEEKVLSKLSELATNTGDVRTARKQTPRLRLPTTKEHQWLTAVIPAIIGHLGRLAADPKAGLLRMTDLPAL